MSELRFEWDRVKPSSNKRKHGVSFSEAATVFQDEAAILIHDPEHSDSEDRFILMGMSALLRTLIVCHCQRTHDIVRIISARRATRREQATYRRRWHE